MSILIEGWESLQTARTKNESCDLTQPSLYFFLFLFMGSNPKHSPEKMQNCFLSLDRLQHDNTPVNELIEIIDKAIEPEITLAWGKWMRFVKITA